MSTNWKAIHYAHIGGPSFVRSFAVVLAFVFLGIFGCDTPMGLDGAVPAEEESVEPAPEVHVWTWFSCRYHGLNPSFTFTASVTPDTAEVAYTLRVEVEDLHDAVGTFRDSLHVDWGGPTEQRVEYRLQVLGHSFEGVSRCTVQ